MPEQPTITVAVPAYNRPEDLGVLLKTIVEQDCRGFDVLVVEDCSPRRIEIRDVVEAFVDVRSDVRVRFVTNPRNLGFDGNLRRILELAEGQFTFFMGDDDLLRPGALRRLGNVIQSNQNLGVVLRAYEVVEHETGERVELFRYFAEDRLFPAGAATMRTFFRRCVAIAGFTIHTVSARKFSTAKLDGTLLYQLYLGTRVVEERCGYFISDVLTAMRKNDRQRHFFGTAPAEQGRFEPGQLTPEHSLQFMRGMVNVARAIEEDTQAGILDGILDDLSNYAYPYLNIHASERGTFVHYVQELRRLGLARTPLFWAYVAALLTVPTPALDSGIRSLKNLLKSTPRFGGLYSGERVRKS